MKKEKSKKFHVMSNNLFLLKIALEEAPFSTIQSLLWGVKHEVIVFIEHIYMIAYIIDSIQYHKPFENVLIFVTTVFVILSIISIFGDYMDVKVRPKANEKIYRRLRFELYEKAKNMDLSCYDDPEFFNNFIWSMNNVTDRVNQVTETIASLLGAVSAILLTGIYIFTQDKTGLVVALSAFVIVYFLRIRYQKLDYELNNALNPLTRRRDYINRIFYLNDYAKEIRLSNIKSKLIENFNSSEKEIQSVLKKKTKKIAFYNFMLMYASNYFIFDFCYLMYLMYITVAKQLIGYGSMFVLYNSCGRLRRNLSSFSQTITKFNEHSLYIEKVRKFLSYKEKIEDKETTLEIPDKVKDVEFRNVSFSYNEKEPVLKNINLTIKSGEKIAIVGYNGAGKTTLVKMIMRLYDVTDGEILYNGVNIKDYKVKEFRSIFATLFQDYQIFAATIKENISMDICDINKKKFEKVLEQSGFSERIKQFKDGIDTGLTREFDNDGKDLSGGERQKISLSRSLYKDSSIIILDEPSSALDPIAEYNLNNTMLHLERDKTIIFISHRLSTTKMADKIYMFDNGEITEQGTHDDLMRLNGKYAEMFNLQAEKYHA